MKKLTAKEAASRIDISAVRAANCMKDIQLVVDIAKQYHFINVHVLPCWVRRTSQLLKGTEDVFLGSPVAFPCGASTTLSKLVEAQQLIQDGVQEMDVVMNIGQFKDGNYEYVLRELQTIKGIVPKEIKTKVIIEINLLDDKEMLEACDLVIQAGADFLKTGTGFIAGGPNIDRVALIKKHCGNAIKIKAAGGIRKKEDFIALYEMGVERMGINYQTAINLVRSFQE